MDPDAISALYTLSLVFFGVLLLVVRWARGTSGIRSRIDQARATTCQDARHGEWVHLKGAVSVDPQAPPLGAPIWLREIEQQHVNRHWLNIMDRCEPSSFLLSDETGTARVSFRGALWAPGTHGTQVEEGSVDHRVVTGIMAEGSLLSVLGRVRREGRDREPYREATQVLDIARTSTDPVIIVASEVSLDYLVMPARTLRQFTIALVINGVVNAVLLVIGLVQARYAECLASTMGVAVVIGLIWWGVRAFAGTKFSPFLHEA